MPKYIDGEKAVLIIDKYRESLEKQEYKNIADAIKDIITVICPTADVEEVKRGEWIYQTSDLFPADSTKECNQCHTRQNLFCDDEYCPHCGAKMDGKGASINETMQ